MMTTDDDLKSYLGQIFDQLESKIERGSSECRPNHSHSTTQFSPSEWLLAKNLSKFILAISDKESGEVIERWQFDIQLEQRPSPLSSSTTSTPQQQPQQQSKTEKEVHAEISGIIRQITSSISFLPILEQGKRRRTRDVCSFLLSHSSTPLITLKGQQTFQVLVYTDLDAPVPATWTDSDARLITTGAQQVRLKSFSTSVHKVDSLVAYKVDED